MHLYLMTRGIKHDVDRFITELQGKYLTFKGAFDEKGQVNPTGELKDIMLQLAVRPIQFWEICFPELHKDTILNSIFEGKDGATQQSKHQKYLWALRKILGCEKIPEYKRDFLFPVYKNNIEMIGIGLKKDYYFPNGMEGI